ncbi:GntR family transcriptional regulator [Phenylobacterium koreense]|uniref:DNA-binding GntR family transcriptional regulator n=1 Tax=Phenylobacterium koreense TaxID=266125 RepID=A0ABV2EM82_9CAUL
MRKRPESFAIALETLRAELRAGVYPAGSRLTSAAIAERLHLSPTPIREALSRLAGDGLLDDRRGQGYFAVQLGASALEHLFALQRDLLIIACSHGPTRVSGALERLATGLGQRPPPERFLLGSEHLFHLLTASAGHALSDHLRRLQDQLAPARRMEPLVLPELEAELAGLLHAAKAEDADELKIAIEAFHRRRIDSAAHLARLQEASTI